MLSMAKSLRLSEAAYTLLSAQKGADEAFSDVILRCVPQPIETFGDLHDYLAATNGALIDREFLKKLRRRKQRRKSSPRKFHAH